MYNFQVKGWHSYFAAPNEGATLGEFAWVHNANKYGSPGTPAHQKTVRDLAHEARREFPNPATHEIQQGKSIRKATGVNRLPDVSVKEISTGRIEKVYEAARKEKSGAWVKRERNKMKDYDDAGIPSSFKHVEERK